jgi:hypothetical protein
LAFSLFELSVSLDSTKLHSDVLFLGRTCNTNFHHPLRSFLKHFCCHQSFQQIHQTMLRVDVFEEQNKHTSFFFKFSTNILRTLSSLLIPVFSYPYIFFEHSKFDLLPNTSEWLPSVLLFWKLKDGLFVHRLVTTLAHLWTFYAIQTPLFSINILHHTHFSTFQTFHSCFISHKT